MDLRAILPEIVALSREAGAKIKRIRSEGKIHVEWKSDHSPLTKADQKASELIEAKLQSLSPNIPVLSEESISHDYSNRKAWPTFWLVDPLDGTRDFIRGGNDFCVNIALIHQGVPTLGVIHAPMSNITHFAAKSLGAFKKISDESEQKISCRSFENSKALALVSHSHLGSEAEVLRALFPNIGLTSMGSSLKFCVIAEGKADIYLRLKPTSEWDIGAGHCIVEEAGGKILDPRGHLPNYNKLDLTNPNFVVFGDKSLSSKLISGLFPKT